MNDSSSQIPIRLGHSPDPDDAFMWYPLTAPDGGEPILKSNRFTFQAVAEDIETLNRRAASGDLEITAISIANYPSVAHKYALTACGSSMGDGYGPKIVARQDHDLDWLRQTGRRIAIPGIRTSAYMTTAMLLDNADVNYIEMPFEEIIEAVAAGSCDAGVVIHEGQLTFQDAGLSAIVDLGQWWHTQTGLPLPLGGNAIRRDLDAMYGPGTRTHIAGLLEASVAYALENREESLDYALRYGRGLDHQLADQFVAMYVNKMTLDFGPTGRAAVARFFEEAVNRGVLTAAPEVDFVSSQPQR